MIMLMALAFRVFVRKRLIAAARKQAGKGLTGSMGGHAAIDLNVTSGGSWCRRLFSRDGYTAVSHIFVMEWAAIICLKLLSPSRCSTGQPQVGSTR